MAKILSFEQEFERRFPKRIPILRIMREAIGVNEVSYSDCTLTNLENVRDLMLKRMAQNSAQVYCAIIKSFLNEVSEEVELPTLRFAKALRVKTVPSQHIALTEDELIMFDEYKPQSQNEADAKILFMRGAFTGARASDCRKMSEDNLHDDLLSYVSTKTKIAVEQPIHKRLMKYLKMQPKKERDAKSVNRTIQSICRKLGFTEEITLYCNGRYQTRPKYKYISMHTSRRSFVSSLAMRGVPISIISKLAGHSSTDMTDKYVCFDVKKVGTEAMSFFND